MSQRKRSRAALCVMGSVSVKLFFKAVLKHLHHIGILQLDIQDKQDEQKSKADLRWSLT